MTRSKRPITRRPNSAGQTMDIDPLTPPTATDPPGLEPRSGLIARRPLAVFSAAAAAALAGTSALCAFVWFHPGGPLADDVVIASAVAVIAAVAGGVALHRVAAHVSRRARRTFVVATALLALFAVAGGATQTVIDDRPVRRGSVEARAIADITALREDLESLVSADALLALPLDQARVRSDDLDAAAVELEELVARWGRREQGSFANRELAESARAAVQAADLGGSALSGAVDLTVQYDEALAAKVAAWREALVSEALRSGQLLRESATRAGVSQVLDAPVRE